MIPKNDLRILVDERGKLAQWAFWQSRGRGRALSAFASEGKRPTLFVADEVLVHASDRELTEQLIREHGARVIPNARIPRPSRGLEVRKELAIPLPVRLRFENSWQIENAAMRMQRVAEMHGGLEGDVSVSSQQGASLAAMVAELSAGGRKIGLNVVGQTAQLPLSSAQEWSGHPAGPDPFQWGCFAGKSRIVQAWQLVESYRLLRGWPSFNGTYIGILDGGFCLDGVGSPFVPPGQSASDFGAGVLQVNLMNSSPAGGKNPSKCSDDFYCPWHGNGVASAAVAAVGNSLGAAGSGGTIGRALLFKTDFSNDQIYYCLNICAAWGIPVLNMSFTIHAWELVFPTSNWNDAFQFATDNGVIVVAAAGNDGEELPDYNVRPATRTPGTITVGALAWNDTARGDSNYGSSVDIWAPGDQIPAAPDDDNPSGTFINATSAASPIVAGVVAMLRYIDPTVDSGRAKQILTTNGWHGADRVTVGLDAFSALYSLMGRTLPDTSEPNNSSVQAAPLTLIAPGGVWAPTYDGITSRPHTGDDDWWRFQTDGYMQASITVESYSPLAGTAVDFVPDDPMSRAADEITQVDSRGLSKITGLLPSGVYRIRVYGANPTAYRLLVKLNHSSLQPDQFEPNDSFEHATRMQFELTPVVLQLHGTWGPGKFDATLHVDPFRMTMVGVHSINPDFFRLDVPAIKGLAVPTVTIANTDVPVNVELYDHSQNLIQSWPAIRHIDVQPPQSTICYLKVWGDTQTRYTIQVAMKVDKRGLPGPLQADPLHLPKWWGDPPAFVVKEVEHYVAEITGDPAEGKSLNFQASGGTVHVALIDGAGVTVREGTNEVSTAGLGAGTYLVRLSAATNGKAGVKVYQLPPKF